VQNAIRQRKGFNFGCVKSSEDTGGFNKISVLAIFVRMPSYYFLLIIKSLAIYEMQRGGEVLATSHNNNTSQGNSPEHAEPAGHRCWLTLGARNEMIQIENLSGADLEAIKIRENPRRRRTLQETNSLA
jgi:hypothetical protein